MTARADGTPDISATVSSASVLFGHEIPVTVRVSNPPGDPETEYGYNLSVRVVVPPGLEYAGDGPAPTTVTDPGTGERTLIFGNVSDVSPGSTYELGFRLRDAAGAPTYDVGSVIPVAADAYVNSEAREVPQFDAAGAPVPGSYTGSTPTVTGNQTINAIEIDKSEPSTEGEILRGVHSNQTTYRLDVTNNGENPTDGVTVVDYLPAALEFLGCGDGDDPAAADNTTDAPTNPGSDEEYPGAGPIAVEEVAGCEEPDSVDTVDGEDHGLPAGVYTRVEWVLGELAPTATVTLRYRAAIPLRANTLTFSGGASRPPTAPRPPTSTTTAGARRATRTRSTTTRPPAASTEARAATCRSRTPTRSTGPPRTGSCTRPPSARTAARSSTGA